MLFPRHLIPVLCFAMIAMLSIVSPAYSEEPKGYMGATAAESAFFELPKQQLQTHINQLQSRHLTDSRYLTKQLGLLVAIDDMLSGKMSPAYFRMMLYKLGSGDFMRKSSEASFYNDLLKILYDRTTLFEEQVLSKQSIVYKRYVDIPLPSIKKIVVTTYRGMHQIPNPYTIQRYESIFKTSKGKTIERSLVDNFQSSFTNLRAWERQLGCKQGFDVYHKVEMTLWFSNDADPVFIHSNSTCPGFSPWNVVWQNNIYVAYDNNLNQNIHKLLFALGSIYHEEYNIPSKSEANILPLFSVNGHGYDTPPLNVSKDYSLAEDLLRILYNSPLFHDYLKDNSVIDYRYDCKLHEENRDCAELIYTLMLASHKNNEYKTSVVRANNDSVLEIITSPRRYAGRDFEGRR